MRQLFRDEKGFTLIEMMNVLVISAIISIGAGIILYSSYRFFYRAEKNTILQREANFAFDVIGKLIREGDHTDYQIYPEYITKGRQVTIGTCLHLKNSSGIDYYVYRENNDLLLKEHNEPPKVLISDLITNLSFSSININIIRVSLELTLDQYSLSDYTSYVFRN